MKTTKRMKILGMFCLMVVVSLATNLTINKLSNDKNSNSFDKNTTAVPAEYAKFSKVVNSLETDFTLAAELSVHAVVNVHTKTPIAMQQYNFSPFEGDPFFDYFFGQPRNRSQRKTETPMQEGLGSGVIISNDGYIVTNNHVVENSKEIEVTLNDKRSFKAKIVGTDPNTDIALIKIEAEKLPVILMGNSDSIKVGEWVLAVGNPFNLTSTVTAGIVSAKARNINIINSKMPIESFIQTDAAINPGNSGGALVNTRGELVGINTAIASQTGSYAGYGFAVPVSIVKKIVSDIRKYGVVQRAMLGVQMRDIDSKLAKDKKIKTLEGAYVNSVTENSAAEKSGIKEGDVIINVNGVDVKSSSELMEQIGRYSPGDKITLKLVRDNEEKSFDVILKNAQGSTGLVSSKSAINLLGATYKDVNEKVRNMYRLDAGVEIKSLSKGKLAEVGIKPGYVILKINNQIIHSEEDIQSLLDNVVNSGQTEKVFYIYGIYPNGKITYYAVDLTDENE